MIISGGGRIVFLKDEAPGAGHAPVDAPTPMKTLTAQIRISGLWERARGHDVGMGMGNGSGRS